MPFGIKFIFYFGCCQIIYSLLMISGIVSSGLELTLRTSLFFSINLKCLPLHIWISDCLQWHFYGWMLNLIQSLKNVQIEQVNTHSILEYLYAASTLALAAITALSIILLLKRDSVKKKTGFVEFWFTLTWFFHDSILQHIDY